MPDVRNLHRYRRRARVYAFTIAPVVALLASSPALLFVYTAVATGQPWWAGLATLKGALALGLSLVMGGGMTGAVFDAVRGPAICPYFERAVGGIETFGRGHGLARRLADLDALAVGLGVRPLSEFGFADDLWGETLVWHDPADGLATVDALRSALAGGPSPLPGSAGVAAELALVADALGKARAQGIRFCLMYRIGDGTSAQEWEIRKGTAF